MNRKQFSEHIGNMDDRLVEQAATLPNYAAQYRKKRIQQIMAAAAVLVLMLCSFSVGALAFAREIIVEVPVEAEKVELKEIGITLLFPYSWKGKYEVVESTAENGSKLWEFCVKSIYDAKTPVDESGEDVYHGTLFSVFQYADHSVSADEFAYDAGIAGFSSYLCSTGKATYAIRYAEGAQFDPENVTQKEEYHSMIQSVQEIQFTMPGVSESVAMYKEEITQQIYELISEAEKVRYKISNPELKILNIEENRAEYLFAADWEPVRTVENDPFMKGMRQAAEKLSDDKEKAYAEQIVHEWLVEMQDWQKTERLEEPVVVMMDSADSWTVYYPYMENREETLIPLAEYIKENWTEDSEARYQSGVNLINEEIGRFRGE